MFDFLKIQFRLGRVNARQLQSLVGKIITDEQLKQIVER